MFGCSTYKTPSVIMSACEGAIALFYEQILGHGHAPFHQFCKGQTPCKLPALYFFHKGLSENRVPPIPVPIMINCCLDLFSIPYFQTNPYCRWFTPSSTRVSPSADIHSPLRSRRRPRAFCTSHRLWDI